MFPFNVRGFRRYVFGLALLPGCWFAGTIFFNGASALSQDKAPPVIISGDDIPSIKGEKPSRSSTTDAVPKVPNDSKPFWKEEGGSSSKGKESSKEKLPSDARALLELAKKAYEKGDLDKAQDLATRAQANQGSVRWGIFETNPASLLKEIQTSRARQNRIEAERLTGEARLLLEAKAKNATERANNVAQAEEKARKALPLYGEVGILDFGDRPQKILADVKAIREKEKLPTATVATNKPTTSKPSTNKPTDSKPSESKSSETAKKPTDGPSTPADVDPSLVIKPVKNESGSRVSPAELRRQADLMCQEASQLQLSGKFVEARAKLIEAHRLGAYYDVDEESPETMHRNLMIQVKKRLNGIAAEAHKQSTEGHWIEAEAKLIVAVNLAKQFELDTKPLDDRLMVVRSNMKKAEDIAKGGYPPLPPVDDPIKTVGAKEPEGPVDPLPPSGKPDRGALLLEQARIEFTAGKLETAKKMAIDIISMNSNAKDEAAALLRTIELEEATMREQTAKRAFQNGVTEFNNRNYKQALAIFGQINPRYLPLDLKNELTRYMTEANNRLDPVGSSVASNDPTKLPGDLEPTSDPTKPPMRPPFEKPIGTGMVEAPTPKVGADSFLKQQETINQVEFQKLRTEALKIESEATARFGRGETDAALMDLENFVNRVKNSNLDATKQALLTRPIEARLDKLRILKHQTDFLAAEARRTRQFKAEMTQEALVKQQKQEEVRKLMLAAGRLMDEHKHKEAFAQVQQAYQLAPDDPSVNAAFQIFETKMRSTAWQDMKKRQERNFYQMGHEVFEATTDSVSGRDPLKISPSKSYREQIKQRETYEHGIRSGRVRSEKEKEIESKMSSNVESLSFKGQSLEDVVDHLRTVTSINFMLDLPALKAAQIDPKTPVHVQLRNISLGAGLRTIAHQAGLTYIIKDEAIHFTTMKGAQGRNETRTIPVGDLIIPVPHANPNPPIPGLITSNQNRNNNNVGPYEPFMGLGNGDATGTPSNLPGGRLSSNVSGSSGGFPVPGPVQGAKHGGTLEKELIRLITQTIRPDSWVAMGGEGTIEYYPLGLALVINQSPQVIEEVEQLLESLRRLQDLEVTVEIKMVSLSESFFERIGLDFNMTIPTGSSVRPGAQPVTYSDGRQGVPLDNRNIRGNVVGLGAPGFPTSDLNLPIRATSFGATIPPYGNYLGNLGGGLSLGLAFLSDLQVQMFLEAAQGDTRNAVLQAPRITTFNGTLGSTMVTSVQLFVTSIDVQVMPNGVVAVQPVVTGLPIQGMPISVLPIVSADRRFVRMTINFAQTQLRQSTVLFPINIPLQGVIQNGPGGVIAGPPVVLTQYIQQPTPETIQVNTTVVVPDGGTVVMGGMKFMSEGRNEYGPPVISKIPYLNRLFKNVGYGRDGQNIMIMVTPRILINREEEERQTGTIPEQD